jgi:putative transposase
VKRLHTDKDKQDKQLIRDTFEYYRGVYGYRQTQLFLYQDHGVWMNHKKVLRLMQEMELRSRVRRKYHHSTRNWNIGDRVTKNILERKFQAEAPNQKWVTDVTQYDVPTFMDGQSNRKRDFLAR